MGDHSIHGRSGIRKRIAKGKQALHERLLSIRRPLGLLSHWIVQVCLSGSRKSILSPDRISTRQISCRRRILQDQKQQMNFPDSMHATVSCPEEHIRRPETERQEYAAFSDGRCLVGRCEPHQIQVGSPTSITGSCQSFVMDLSNSPSPQFQRNRLQSGGSLVSGARETHVGNGRQFYMFQNEEATLENTDLLRRYRDLAIDRSRSEQKLRELSSEYQKRLEELQNARYAIRKLQFQLDAAEGKVHQLEHCPRNCPKCSQGTHVYSLEALVKEKHDENLSLNQEVLDLNSTVAALQKISREHESCAIPTSAEPDSYPQYNAIGGSYADESATPSLLNTALSNTKAAITRFQRAFAEAIKHACDSASVVDLLIPDAHFARSSHISFAVKAAVYEVFFEGFENESFNTCSGVSSYLDPGVRQGKCYEYYVQQKQNHSSNLGDLQFDAFCEMKVPRLWEKFNLQLEKTDASMQGTCLEVLGGSQLVSSFRLAAMNVWLLHKLAFSFEPPASIFRVGQGIGVDLDYMDPVVNLEDSKKFVNEVGFMIAPGLRIGKTVLPCEVYLSGGTTVVL